jgi:hypothetical protein
MWRVMFDKGSSRRKPSANSARRERRDRGNTCSLIPRYFIGAIEASPMFAMYDDDYETIRSSYSPVLIKMWKDDSIEEKFFGMLGLSTALHHVTW